MIRNATLFALLSVVLFACHSIDGGDSASAANDLSVVTVGETYYLQTNLHAEPGRDTVWTTNYQQAMLIPAGSEVRVESAQRKAMTFTVLETGGRYVYTLDRHLKSSFADNIAKVFGKEDPSARIAEMSDVDREGIRTGTAQVGMTRDGVLVACGYPPDHATPSLEVPQWVYWRNRWVKRIVNFDADGKVSSVQG